MLQSIYMLLQQLAEGRSEVENQYSRVVPWDGNLKALAGHQRGHGAAALLRVARPRLHLPLGAAGARRATPPSTPSGCFEVPGVRVADPKACQCGEVLKGVLKPWECKVFGTACTPETPIGTCMVSSEGACAAYYNFGRFTRERVEGSRRPTAPRDRSADGSPRPRIDRASPVGGAPRGAGPASGSRRRARRKAKVKEERITLAHGVGRQGDPDADRGRVPGGVPQPAAGAAGGRGRARPSAGGGWPSPPTPTWCRRCSSPAATSATWPSTAPSTTWPCAGPGRCGCRPGSSSRRASRSPTCERIVASMAAAAAAAGVPDRHRRHQGRAAGQGRRLLHQHRRASG